MNLFNLFEYDSSKSDSNEQKHGIDFEEIQELWHDLDRIEFDLDYGGEKRFAVIGRLSDGYWTVVCTMRGDTIRIISARRATKKEMALYDKEKNDR